GDAPSGERCLHDHFACELHARGAQAQTERCDAIDPTQSTMEIADAGGEKQPAGETQHRISEETMQEGHGTGSNPTAKALTYDQSVASAQTVDERGEPREIVAVVGIRHDDESAVRHPESCQ